MGGGYLLKLLSVGYINIVGKVSHAIEYSLKDRTRVSIIINFSEQLF